MRFDPEFVAGVESLSESFGGRSLSWGRGSE